MQESGRLSRPKPEPVMIDPNHPFYEPLWRRILIPGVCFVWAVVELLTGSVTWAAISGALGVFAAYKLLVEWRPRPPAVPASRDEAQED